MNKLTGLIAPLSVFIIIAAPFVLAQDCVPNYICNEWSECKDGFTTRTCTDAECGGRDITERSFCSGSRCTPQIECGEWSACIYEGKADNLIRGEITFGGHRTRLCDDVNDCIPRFIQEGACEDSYKLLLSPVRECGQNLLVAKDPLSEYTIAKIDLDRWKAGKFDLAFVQGDRKYCPSCYNAVRDENEEGIDCGGDCEPCKTERRYLLYLAILSLWAGSFIFTFLSFRQFLILRKPEEVLIEQQ